MSERNRYLVGCNFIRGNVKANSKLKNMITIVECVNGEKRVINIEDPDIHFYVDKEGCPEEETNRIYVPREHVEAVKCKYSKLPEFMANEIGVDKAEFRKICNETDGYKNFMASLRRNPIFHGADINIEDHYIRRYFDKYADEIIEGPVLHKAHSDIEVDVYNASRFPTADEAEYPIDLISIYSNQSNEMWTYALADVDPPNPLIDELRKDKEKFKEKVIERFNLTNYSLLFFNNELDLIKSYFRRIHHMKPDFLGFWNMLSFDFKYLYNRISKLTGQHPSEIMCPPRSDKKHLDFPMVDIDFYEDTKSHDYSTMASYVKVVGWVNFIDQLVTYANLRATMGKKDSYALDDIASEILDEREGSIHKDPLPVSIRDFSRWNYEQYIMYNLQDVHLLHRIEKKTRDIDLIYRIAMTTRTRIHKAWRKTVSLRNMADMHMNSIDYVISNNHNVGENTVEHEKFEGAWVADPMKNAPLGTKIGFKLAKAFQLNPIEANSSFVFDNVADLDLASLYPSIIQAFMIDPANQFFRVSYKPTAESMETGHKVLDDFTTLSPSSFYSKWFNIPTTMQILNALDDGNIDCNLGSLDISKFGILYLHWETSIRLTMSALLNRNLTKKELEYLKFVFYSNFRDIPCVLNNSYKKENQKSTFGKVLIKIYNENPIITGNGTLFKREDLGGLNVTGSFIGNLLGERKRIKKELFSVKEAGGNKSEEDRLDMRQKVYKVLANAFYGALGQPSFIFYDLNSAPAVTLTGQYIITTLVRSFEGFFGDNWNFDGINDVLRYLATVPKNPEKLSFSRSKISEKKLYTRLIKKLKNAKELTEREISVIKRTISLLTADERYYAYYCNNLFKFLEEDECLELVGNILDYEIPSGNDEDIKDEKLRSYLERLFSLINQVVVSKEFFEGRANFCETTQRNTVLVCDTDSTFILVDKFVKYIYKNFDINKSSETTLTSCNVAVYLLSKYSKIILADIADKLCVEEDKKKHLSLKNEFYYKRIMLSKNKKSYAGYLAQREGVPITDIEEQLDIKGLDIKKVKVNLETRTYFQKVLAEEILGINCDENHTISSERVIESFIEYEKLVRDSIINREVKFSRPTKYSGHYVYPYRMEQFRGVLVWNDLYPDQLIKKLEYVNMIKTIADTYEKFQEIVADNDFSKEDLKYIRRIEKICFKFQEMQPYGFSRLCMPRSVKTLPSWVVPFVDTDTIIDDNIKSALILLECIGISCLEVRGSNKYTNILTF